MANVLTGFKVTKVTKPLQKTPLSEYRWHEYAKGEMYVGGVYYDKTNQSIPSVIMQDGMDGRDMTKDKMFISDTFTYEFKGDENEKVVEYAKRLKRHKDYVRKLMVQIRAEGFPAKAFYKKVQNVKKIGINSFFGAIGNEYFPSYNKLNANAITLGGQDLIKYFSNNFDGKVHGLHKDYRIIKKNGVYYFLDRTSEVAVYNNNVLSFKPVSEILPTDRLVIEDHKFRYKKKEN